MKFLDRTAELQRLLALHNTEGGGLGLVWGRRRVGKTRLLVEWIRRTGGIYTVADQSASAVQRRYFAEALSGSLAGFSEPEYPDWRTLLRALGRQAANTGWRGPLVVDELPYLAAVSPELPATLQAFVDHDARQAGIWIVLAGSSQRMMQGLQLDRSSPLFGRATEAIELQPLAAGFIGEALGTDDPVSSVRAWSAWGGIPRYWELAQRFGPDTDAAVDSLVLDPAAPLHLEPDRLLVEEMPPATALRPLLDAVGSGAHRVSEIAGRLGTSATSLSRPLTRLQELGLLQRDKPFGEPEPGGKRSLYRIGDPFTRMWFRIVAPHRAALATGGSATRSALWKRYTARLTADAWEDLCRASLSRLPGSAPGGAGPWGPALRYWKGTGPEWDLVSASMEGDALLLGEAKWSERPFTEAMIEEAARALLAKGIPSERWAHGKRVIHALFVPRLARVNRKASVGSIVEVFTADQVLAVLR
jgi:uncharacterized protein